MAWLAGVNAKPMKTLWSKSGKPFVEFSADEREAVVGELDTGGGQTEVSATYAGARTGDKDCQGIGLSGKCVEGATLDDRTVHFAGEVFARVRLSVREEIHHADDISNEHALVGMDVLRACVLASPQPNKLPVLAACSPKR